MGYSYTRKDGAKIYSVAGHAYVSEDVYKFLKQQAKEEDTTYRKLLDNIFDDAICSAKVRFDDDQRELKDE